MNSLAKYVASTALTSANWNNSHVINASVADEIAKLKQAPGQDIVIHGSAVLINSLIPHGLIDEYRLMIHPVVVGRGKRLFADGIDATTLHLAETTPLPSGVVVLTDQSAASN